LIDVRGCGICGEQEKVYLVSLGGGRFVLKCEGGCSSNREHRLEKDGQEVDAVYAATRIAERIASLKREQCRMCDELEEVQEKLEEAEKTLKVLQGS
jgi:hypothetical protein